MDRRRKTGESRNAVDGFSETHDPQLAADELDRRLDTPQDRRSTPQCADAEKP